MKRAWVLLALALLCWPAHAAGAAGAAWRWRAPIDAGGRTGLLNVAVPATSPVWDKLRTDLADLRIFDGQGQEVPYLLWRPGQGATREVAPRLLNVGHDGGRQAATATLDLGTPPPLLTALHLDVEGPLPFLRPVLIQGSSDQQQWVDLPTTDYLYDLALQGGERSTVVRPLRPVQMRYVRVFLLDAGGEPLRIRGARGEAGVPALATAVETVFTGKADRSSRPEQQASVYTVDLGQHRPVGELQVQTGQQNFHRTVAVEGSRDARTWQPLGRGVLYEYNLLGQYGSNPPLRFAECICRYLRLVVADGNDQPLDLHSVTVAGLPARLLFMAQPDQAYWLHAGNATAGRPSYDIARLPVDRGAAGLVPHGALAANPAYQPGAGAPWTERHRWVLWGALAVTVIVIGLAVVRMARRIASDGS